jgi:hypothetical protein
MSRACEVCSSKLRIRRVLVQDRVVALCDEHAAEVRVSGASTLEALCALFPETGGQRSRIDRRSPLDRRVFPPRPEGRRRSAGRRAHDRFD